MREAKLKSKLVSIAETRWGQAIVDRQWWEKLEEPLGWKLVSYSGRFHRRLLHRMFRRRRVGWTLPGNR